MTCTRVMSHIYIFVFTSSCGARALLSLALARALSFCARGTAGDIRQLCLVAGHDFARWRVVECGRGGEVAGGCDGGWETGVWVCGDGYEWPHTAPL